MYIKNIKIQNLGAISDLNITPQFDEQDNPYPIIILGKNGTGKTLLLANILDSLIEFKRKKYSNIQEVEGNSYLKIGKKTYVKNNSLYSYVNILFEDESIGLKYVDCMTITNGETFRMQNPQISLDGVNFSDNKFNQEGFYKAVMTSNNIPLDAPQNVALPNFFKNNVFLFFPHSRYDNPAWLNQENKIGFEFKEKFVEKSGSNIIKDNVLKEIENWILDCLLDRDLYEKKQLSLSEFYPLIQQEVEKLNSSQPNSDREALEKEIANQIIGEILKFLKESPPLPITGSYSGKNTNIINLINELLTSIYKNKFPNIQNARIGVGQKYERNIAIIIKENDKETQISPSFSQLSSGEIMLLSLFTSILKEYDSLGLTTQNLADIKGIVIIDEIDLHLHIEFQKTILPELIKKFPKIQFVITTHSPFFLMGMDEVFQGKCSFINMPYGNQIEVHHFSEVNTAYDVFTKGFNQIQTAFQTVNEKLKTITKPLIITEGKTDWKHLKNALKVLKGQGFYTNLDFEFLEYEDEIPMGDSSLKSLCEQTSKFGQNRKVICVFDRDGKDEIMKAVQGINGYDYKDWGNSFYSFCIPIPSHRTNYNKISIEFYYTDDEIKTIDTETNKRLLFTNEVEEIITKSATIKEKTTSTIKCLSNPKQEEERDKKIYDQDIKNIKDDNGNLIAHSKSAFIENILNEKSGFNNFNVGEFKKIFDIIEKIIQAN